MKTEPKLPRAIRLNNPGNIRHTDTHWQGMALDQPDAEFLKFQDPVWGIRAMCKIWKTYKKRDADGTLTLPEIINQWAPNTENPTELYIKNVCEWTGFSRTDSINVRDLETLKKLVPAFIRQEAGYCPYDSETIEAGCKLALE